MSIKKQFQVAVVNETNLSETAVTFDASADTSSVLDCGGTTPASIVLPSGWTECDITFLVSKTPAGPFVPMNYFDGDDYIVHARASMCIPLIPSLFHSQLYVKLKCSINQVSACTVDFGLTPIYQGIHA